MDKGRGTPYIEFWGSGYATHCLCAECAERLIREARAEVNGNSN